MKLMLVIAEHADAYCAGFPVHRLFDKGIPKFTARTSPKGRAGSRSHFGFPFGFGRLDDNWKM